MPLGTGYSVEAQITGLDLIGGLQVEVTPVKEDFTTPDTNFNHMSAPFVPTGPVVDHSMPGLPRFLLTVRTLTGEHTTFKVSGPHTVDHVKEMIQDSEGIPPDQQRLKYQGKQIEDGRTLSEYGIKHDCLVCMVFRLSGGGYPVAEMGVAAGGLVKQSILRDYNDPEIWDPASGTIFNVQILNSAIFKTVTGEEPPMTPVTAETYAQHGFPYFAIYDEKPSGISGDFEDIQSVAGKDLHGVATLEKAKAVAEVIQDFNNPVVMLDPKGRYSGFRSVKTMEKELVEKFGKVGLH